MLSRQPLPTLDRQRYASAAGVARGGYVLADPPGGEPEVILIATGSEVAMTVDAYERLTADGIRARVVSMPSMELFDKQPRSYPRRGTQPVGHRPGVGGEGVYVRLGPLGRVRRAPSSG
jgi:transketolase